jgi:transcriptional regulator with XRE-family HTH domain
VTTPSQSPPFFFLPNALRSLRQRKGWDQEELARRAGIGNATISRYESGHSTPNVSKLITLLETMGVGERDLWQEMERARAAGEDEHPIPLALVQDSDNLELRLIALYLQRTEVGNAEAWLDQMSATVKRLRKIQEVRKEMEDSIARGRKAREGRSENDAG